MVEVARLPDWIPPHVPPYVPPSRPTLTRPTASSLRASTPTQSEVAMTLAGFNETIPVTYGEDRISGLWLTRPVVVGGNFVAAIAWGWGEVEGVQDVYINGADVPSGVTMTHYTGAPGQAPDPTLQAALPGFFDAYERLCYTVFVIPPGTVTGFPQTHTIEAVLRGRKVYDERTGLTQYSDNPGLCLADFITSDLYGPGLPVYGVSAVADRCDDLVQGVEVRARLGLTLSLPVTADANIDMLSAYAEVLWSYEGEGVLLVPDAPVDEPVAVLTTDDIVEDSLRLTGNDLLSAPTVVTITSRADSQSAEQWPGIIAEWRLPGTATGEVPETRSDVPMPGIRRQSELERKASMRGARLRFPGAYAFQLFDRGIKYQKGDVIQLPDTMGLSTRLVRILSHEMIAVGRYQATAEPYDPSMYSDDGAPTSEASVPVGAGLIWSGSEAPDGYELSSIPDNLFIRGGTTVGETGGSTAVSVSGQTTLNGAHSGSPSAEEYWFFGDATDGNPPGANDAQRYWGSADNHFHDYSGSGQYTPLTRRQRIIVKTGSPGQIPELASVLSNGQILSGALEIVNSHNGRLLSQGAPGNTGQSSPRTIAVTLDTKGQHGRGGIGHKLTALLNLASFFGPFPPVYQYVSAGGHNHPGSAVSVSYSVKRRRLAMYQTNRSAFVIPGMILLYFLNDPLPAGFYVCDGNNGTPDLTDHFIEISPMSNAGTAEGNNTASWSSATRTDGAHNHRGDTVPPSTHGGDYSQQSHGNDDGGHAHTMSGSSAYLPPYYTVKFIQYTGVV